MSKKIITIALWTFLMSVFMISFGACDINSISVIKDGDNAYVYNGTRYVYKSQLQNYDVDILKDSIEIGYAYAAFETKYMVYIAESDKNQDIIYFKENNAYFRKIFLKEKAEWFDILDCTVKNIKCDYGNGVIKILERNFRWRDVVSGEGISEVVFPNNSIGAEISCDLICYDHIFIRTYCWLYQEKIYFGFYDNFGDDYYYYEVADEEIFNFLLQYLN